MQKIKFQKNDTIYNINLSSYISTEDITRMKLNFDSKDVPSSNILQAGFIELNEHNDTEQGDYRNLKYIYKSFDNGICFILTNVEGDIEVPYVEPIPEQPEQPEVSEPTEEEIEINFKMTQYQKIEETKSLLETYLKNNPLVSTAHGNKEGIYSITQDKQTLMASQYVSYIAEKAIRSNAILTWNETGKSCEVWSEEEFLTLMLEIKEKVYPLVSKQQRYEEAILNCTDIDMVTAIAIIYDEFECN